MKLRSLWIINVILLFSIISFVFANEEQQTPIKAVKVENEDELGTTSFEESIVQLEELETTEKEKFTFQTEVSRLMHLIINSLYKTREIFLRELISNAADALDKIRFLSLTDPEAIAAKPILDIRISADPKTKTLTITDTGIGMTRQQLKNNLGTIAKSGTSEFLAQMENNKDAITQIGQFGVGFYSVFLVADKVTVASKSNDDPDQYVWMSTAVNDFTIAKDPRGNTLQRGTQITLYLKPDAYEFLETKKLKELIQRYSQFITFPIQVLTAKEKEIPVEEINHDDDDLIEESMSDEKPITEKRTVYEWELVNVQKPIWMRDSKNITDEEHKEFYKSLTRDYADPLAWTMYKGEGEFEFRSLLYIPSTVNELFYQNIKNQESNHPIKLFVKRVFISDEFELLPKWLSFLKGIVDADDMPLNVSRETLQRHRSLRVITRHLVKKALEMFSNLSQRDPKAYAKFLGQYNNILKYGAIEDQVYRKKITSLLRFASSHNKEPFSNSLDDYVDRCKANQKSIYFMTGSSVSEIEQSPLIESLLARGYEVMYFTDPIDELFVENVPGYNGKQFVNIAKGDLTFPEDEKDPENEIALETTFRPLTDWLRDTLHDRIEKAVISNRLTTSPFAIVASATGLSGHAQRILDAQGASYKDPNMAFILETMRSQKKILEINPKHPVITSLLKQVEEDSITDETTNLIQLMYDTTAIRSGFPVDDITQFAGRVEGLIRKAVGVSLLEKAEVNIKKAKEKTEEERKADEELKKTNIIYDQEEAIHHDEL
ncbi:Hsp90 protein-domain-containing protein [Cokeromyces recurvatus]|uniref:Hsp90 protein-domain-containing protein n=1 Tax=Cokeromyces recurvatus TaxID=90255 RepID=UPI0022208D3C|nr:Hsp90 protein-domain-containing protein [Cokeromyces recurvatus]KAI7902559.1 Hsp90 protein-domain-containing protein [Cokeromyces recurvatus]